jgi:predicted dehydrogenase
MYNYFSQGGRMNVLNIGFGKAAAELHGNNWRAEGLQQLAYDVNAERLDISKKSEKVQAAFAAGQIDLVPTLEELTEAPDILDIATSSGQHLAGLKEGLSVYARLDTKPRAVLLEKPVVNPDEMAEFDELLAAWGIEPITVVNENYLASSGLIQALKIGRRKAEEGIVPEKVFVSFDKDRVPDVLNGRFTDPVLGAYGIEMPHMVSVANALAGVSHDEQLHIQKNQYRKNVQGVEHSEATFVQALSPQGVEIVMAQGLGPFRMDKMGTIHPQDIGKNIFRFANVAYSDGSLVRVDFAPVEGAPNYHVVVSEFDGDTLVRRSAPIEDNSMKQVIQYVIETAETGTKPVDAHMLDVETAKQTVRTLDVLRQTAEVIDEA